MARAMPPMAASFRSLVGSAIALAEAGETIRSSSAVNSLAHHELTVQRLEALHEMAYLRIFVGWEEFLEATFLRLMCGYRTLSYVPVYVPGRTKQRTLATAELALFGGRDYLLWHNPYQVRNRGRDWFVGAPHELVISSTYARLEWLASLRHRVAHGSKDARRKADIATLGLCGRRFPAASAGRFLRSWNTNASPPERWLHTLGGELSGLATQIA
jgi:hypothetical protein